MGKLSHKDEKAKHLTVVAVKSYMCRVSLLNNFLNK